MAKKKTQNTNVKTWVPNLGPQTLAMYCPADIILYGGAAGGGKTDLGIIWASIGIQIPGYQAIIFRRTFPELEKHIIERSFDLFSGIGRYNEKKHCWTFQTPDNGTSRIFFGYLEHDKDVFKYSGDEYIRMVFDESTLFSEWQIRFMLTRNRSAKVSSDLMRRQLLLTTNPIGPGFGFHKLMFIEDQEHGRRKACKVYNDAKWPSDGMPLGKTTCFVPATLNDNPVLLKQDPGYVQNLKTQSGGLARALMAGSWDETISNAVVFDRKIHSIDPIDIPAAAPRWIGIDWGKTDKACTTWLTSFGGRIYAYRSYARPGKIIVPYAQEIVAKSIGETINFVVLSHECFADRGHGAGNTQADQFISVFSKAQWPTVKSDKDPEGRLMLLREFLRVTPVFISATAGGIDDTDYWQARIMREGDRAWKEYARLKMLLEQGDKLPRLQLFRPSDNMNSGCSYLIESLPLLTVDVAKPKRIADGQDDHGFDSLTYGLKFWLNYDEEKLMTAYQEQLGGAMPESTFQAQFAMKAAQDRIEEAEGTGGDEPFQMKTDRFDSGGGGDNFGF